MRRLLAAALLWGCGGEPCVRVEGVCVEGYEGDEDALAAELQRCAERIPIDGAWVRFVADADRLCGQRSVAGCWLPHGDIAVVEHGEPSETALCHELTHRAQFRAEGVIDYEHTDPRWWNE